MALKIYKKQLDISYTFGVFPTIELLKKAPSLVKTVLLATDSTHHSGVKEIIDLCQLHNINYDFGDRAIRKLAVKDNTNVIGVFSKYTSSLESNTNHLLLFNPSDMGNVGTIIRTMAGFNISNLAIIKPAVDVFDPKVVRSTMGALFEVNIEYFNEFNDYIAIHKSNVLYPFVLKGKNVLGEFKFQKPATLIFGNEGSGLDSSFESMDTSVTINHSSKIDSLNLATSCAIALYEFNKTFA